ncbi:protein wech-like isoform X2 [Haliotis rubra]|uniref:protein wech-like isoform X2 n=1 Tax=Haliotis rubra TaxID=36100 RepID=UPI001EE521E2|nr:protein wech-like isoform X2 [Haliotis rubra]
MYGCQYVLKSVIIVRMATAGLEKKVKDNFLTCSICFEMYTDPCTLRCDHTFCRKCITSYIQTRPDAVQSKTIPCPCCRQDTKVPHPSRPVEEWAGQIKASIVIQGLIDTYRSDVAVQETSSTCCTICQQLGETTPGALWCPECEVALCDKCVKTHRVTPTSLNHDLCDLSSRSKVKRMIKCTEHKSNRVEFHCQDCGKAACQTCCIIYHRACKTVVTIESMKPGMKAALMEKRLGMEKRLKVRSKKVDIRNEKLESNSRITESALQNIRLICQTAISKIKQKETQLLDELNNISQTYAGKLQADVKMEEIEMQMYRQHCEFIDQALVSGCEMDLYDAYQVWESGAVKMEDVRDTEAADIRRIEDIIFTPDTDNVLKVLDNLQLGKTDVTYQDQGTCLPSLVLVDTRDGRVSGDDGEPYLQDVTVLVVDGVQTCVVTDYNNKCVKSFFTRNNHSSHSKLPLGNSPKGITQLNEKQVMVAVPLSLQIVTIEVTPDLVLLSTTKTRTGYDSLAVLNPSCLAAGTKERMDILDMAGHVLRSVITEKKTLLFAYPDYIFVTNKGNILVSDYGKKYVTCLTSEGDVLWRYAPAGDKALSYPCGITTTSTGDILLVDRDTYKVIQLTESGEFVRELLTLEDGGETGMRDIFCDKYGFLFLCTDTEVKEYVFV